LSLALTDIRYGIDPGDARTFAAVALFAGAGDHRVLHARAAGDASQIR
jgi:hypothetical protein